MVRWCSLMFAFSKESEWVPEPDPDLNSNGEVAQAPPSHGRPGVLPHRSRTRLAHSRPVAAGQAILNAKLSAGVTAIEQPAVFVVDLRHAI